MSLHVLAKLVHLVSTIQAESWLISASCIFEPHVRTYEPLVSIFEPQVGLFEPQVSAFGPKIGPYTLQLVHFSLMLALMEALMHLHTKRDCCNF